MKHDILMKYGGLYYKYTSGVWMHESDSGTVADINAAVIRACQLVSGSDLGPGSLPRPPRLGALPAVPQHPVRALALLRAVPRAGPAGGALAAPIEVLLLARRLRGQAGGRYAARAATPPTEHLQSFCKVGVAPTQRRAKSSAVDPAACSRPVWVVVLVPSAPCFRSSFTTAALFPATAYKSAA